MNKKLTKEQKQEIINKSIADTFAQARKEWTIIGGTFNEKETKYHLLNTHTGDTAMINDNHVVEFKYLDEQKLGWDNTIKFLRSDLDKFDFTLLNDLVADNLCNLGIIPLPKLKAVKELINSVKEPSRTYSLKLIWEGEEFLSKMMVRLKNSYWTIVEYVSWFE